MKESIKQAWTFAEFSRLELFAGNLAVEIKPGEQFQVEYNGQADHEVPSVELSGQVLTIYRKPLVKQKTNHWLFKPSIRDDKLVITVAASFLNSIETNLAAGDFALSVGVDHLKVLLNAGDLTITNCQVLDASLSLLAGDTKLTNAELTSGEIALAAGDLHVTNGKLAHVEIKLSAGDVKYQNVTLERGSLDTLSGDVFLTNCILEDLYYVSSFAGDVQAFACQYKTLDLKAAAGSIRVGNNNYSERYQEQQTDKQVLHISAKAGDIVVRA